MTPRKSPRSAFVSTARSLSCAALLTVLPAAGMAAGLFGPPTTETPEIHAAAVHELAALIVKLYGKNLVPFPTDIQVVSGGGPSDCVDTTKTAAVESAADVELLPGGQIIKASQLRGTNFRIVCQNGVVNPPNVELPASYSLARTDPGLARTQKNPDAATFLIARDHVRETLALVRQTVALDKTRAETGAATGFPNP